MNQEALFGLSRTVRGGDDMESFHDGNEAIVDWEFLKVTVIALSKREKPTVPIPRRAAIEDHPITRERAELPRIRTTTATEIAEAVRTAVAPHIPSTPADRTTAVIPRSMALPSATFAQQENTQFAQTIQYKSLQLKEG